MMEMNGFTCWDFDMIDRRKISAETLDILKENMTISLSNTKDISALTKVTEKLSTEVWGTGDHDPGIKQKVHDLWQFMKEFNWWRLTIATVVIGLVIERVWSIFLKGH